MKLTNGVECGAIIGNIPYKIRRHCTAVHKMDMTSRGNPSGPYTNRDEYIRDCLAITLLHNLPLRFWHSKPVRARERRLQSGFKVNVSDVILKSELDREFNTMMLEIGEILSTRMYSMKFDMGSRMDKNILGIGVQYIDNWEIKIKIVGMNAIVGKSTALAIKEGIRTSLDVVNADPIQAYSTTTDGGANVRLAGVLFHTDSHTSFSQRAPAFETVDELDDNLELAPDGEDEQEQDEEEDELEMLQFIPDDDEDDEEADDQARVNKELAPIIIQDTLYFNDIKCAAHIVQNGVNDFINRRKKKIKQVKYYVKKVRRTMERQPKETRPPKPTLANETRWSSTYRMVSYL